MSGSLLFGYSVEENDEKFVITLAGKLAVPIMQDIAANVGAGRRGGGQLPGLFPYSLLASHAVGLARQANVEGEKGEAELADIFGQGFDKDLDEYERHLERYRSLLPSGVVIAHGGTAQSFSTEIDIEDKSKPKAASPKS